MQIDKTNLIPLAALFPYKGAIRRLVHNIKIKRCIVSLDELCELVIKADHLLKLLAEVETITPVGPSLFSKIHGKFDLSYLVAHRISQAFDIPLLVATNPNQWRYKKRSKLDHKNLLEGPSPPFHTIYCAPTYNKQEECKDCVSTKPRLIIDDVVTTGYTFYQQILSTGFPQSSVKCLAICDARPQKIRNISGH